VEKTTRVWSWWRWETKHNDDKDQENLKDFHI
jgi:hypothetical protein